MDRLLLTGAGIGSAIAGVTILVGCFLDLPYQAVLSIGGLTLDGIGAIMVLSGELRILKIRFVPNRRIENIKSARRQMYENIFLRRGDKGFEEIVEIIEQNFILEENTRERLLGTGRQRDEEKFKISDYVDCISYGTLPSHASSTSSKTKIYGWTKLDGQFTKEDVDLSSESSRGTIGDPDDFFGPWPIAPALPFEALISQRLLNLEQKGLQSPLRAGVLLLLIGFTLQIISQFPTIGLTFGFC